ncbi:fimbrial protein [Providencia sneebia]|uniref:Fimbrial subunit n=1 Tax=Providencia sneebia DSM 19967 TaxID=1141660 RepID=K8WJC3_9GAMM|nr:fimbrial protein [Providencia sneebia]EKT57577.1 fimbrial subunit [Providencia sneebia DSM 19967]
MKIINKLKIFSLFILMSCFSQADVIIDVTAKLIDPACTIRSKDNSKPLQINFGSLNPELINTPNSTRDFSIYISGCDSTNLAIIVTPKTNGAMSYNGRNILSTNTSGLGIDLKQVNGTSVRDLEISKLQRIYPVKNSSTESRLDLKAQLVNVGAIGDLALGQFSTSATFTVTYN